MTATYNWPDKFGNQTLYSELFAKATKKKSCSSCYHYCPNAGLCSDITKQIYMSERSVYKNQIIVLPNCYCLNWRER